MDSYSSPLNAQRFLRLPLVRTDGICVIRKNDTANPVFVYWKDVLADIANQTGLLSAVTADSGLTTNTPSNVQLGGATLGSAPLLRPTYIDSNGFFTVWSGGVRNAANLFVQNTDTTGFLSTAIIGDVISARGSGVWGRSSGSGQSAGLRGSSDIGYGVEEYADTGDAGYFRVLVGNNSTPTKVIRLRAQTSAPTSGSGPFIFFDIPLTSVTDSSDFNGGNIGIVATTLTQATRVSQYEIYLYNAGVKARKLALTGIGQLILDKYGINTFAGTPTYALGVDASGNVVEFAASGGGAVSKLSLFRNGELHPK